MNFNLKFATATLVFSIFISLALTSQADDAKTRPTLEDLSWLVGHWQGPGFGGICEEVWLPASAGSMVGTFKMSVNGEVQFYELMVITVDSTGPTLKLKHFNSDMTGWEEKDEVINFAFNSAKENELSVGATTYKLIAKDSLDIFVDVGNKDGSVRREIISCHLVK